MNWSHEQAGATVNGKAFLGAEGDHLGTVVGPTDTQLEYSTPNKSASSTLYLRWAW